MGKQVFILVLLCSHLLGFTQNLDYNKIDSVVQRHKQKMKSKFTPRLPLELIVGYGGLISFNNDSIYQLADDEIISRHTLLDFDTSNTYNFYSLVNMGFRTSIKRFRLGIYSKIGWIKKDNEGSGTSYFIDQWGTSFISNEFDYKVNQKVSLYSVNLCSDYLFMNQKKLKIAIGLDIGYMFFQHNRNKEKTYNIYQYNIINNQTTFTGTYEYVQKLWLIENNSSFCLSPSMSFGFYLTERVKIEPKIFYCYQFNNNIIQNSNYSPTFYRYNFKNPSKLGINLNLILKLNK